MAWWPTSASSGWSASCPPHRRACACLQRLGQLRALPYPADERGRRCGEGGCRARPLGAGVLGRAPGEGPPVRDLQLAQQRGDM
jgi:hypothetical protein